MPAARSAFFQIFPARRHQAERWEREVRKRAREAARYVLPVATFAHLYHTVSAITLLRYHRLCALYDAPHEQRLVIGRMVAEVLHTDPEYAAILEEPLPSKRPRSTPPSAGSAGTRGRRPASGRRSIAPSTAPRAGSSTGPPTARRPSPRRSARSSARPPRRSRTTRRSPSSSTRPRTGTTASRCGSRLTPSSGGRSPTSITSSGNGSPTPPTARTSGTG